MDLRETKNFDGIEEEVNHWWIRTRFNYINEIIEYYNSNNINIVEYGCGTCNNIYHLINNSPHSSKINSIIGIDPNLENLDNPVWAKDSNCFSTIHYPEHTKLILYWPWMFLNISRKITQHLKNGETP